MPSAKVFPFDAEIRADFLAMLCPTAEYLIAHGGRRFGKSQALASTVGKPSVEVCDA